MGVPPRFRFGEVVFSPSEQQLLREGKPVRLDPKTSRLLECLVDCAGQIVSKDLLLSEVWEDVIVSDAALTQAVMRLRAALGDEARTPHYIETVHRRGFRFIAPVHTDSLAAPAALETTFVGREKQLARLTEARFSAEQGQRQVVVVRGEMGIGKTALIDEFAASVPPDWLVLRSQCVEQYGSREPFMPLLEAIEDLVKSSRGPEAVGVLRRHAPTLLGQMPWVVGEREARELSDQLAAGTRPRMLRETASALEALCGRGLLLIIEDLHWSDPATLDLVAAVARRRGSANLMVLGSFRDGEAIAFGHPVIALARDLEVKGQCVSLSLDPLPMSAIDAFLKRRLASAGPPPALAKLLHDRTDGNPLFLHTLLDHMIDIGWLADDGGQWRLRDSADLDDGAAFPSSLRQMIGAFLDRIDADDLEILEAASVVGVTFSTAGVAAALKQASADVEQIDVVCARLADRWRILQPAAEQIWPDATRTSRYRFRHALFHAALYDRITASKRRRLHQLVGERMAEGYRGRTGGIAAELATHFEISGDDARAVVYLIEAASGARGRFSYNEELEYLASALERVPRLPSGPQRELQEVWIRVNASTVSSYIQGLDSKADDDEVLERSTRILHELPDGPVKLALLRGLWLWQMVRCRPTRLLPLAEHLLRLASATRERAQQVEAGVAMSLVRLFSGQFADAVAEAERAWGLYRAQTEEDAANGKPATLESRSTGIWAAGVRAWALHLHGLLDRAAAAWSDTLDLCQSGPTYPFYLGAISFTIASCEALVLNLSSARQYNRQVLNLAEENEIIGMHNGATLQRIWLDLDCKDFEGDPSTLLAQWPELSRHSMARPTTDLYFVQACAVTGNVAQGLDALESLKRDCAAAGLHWYDAELLLAEADLLYRRGGCEDRERAEVALRDAVALASRQGARLFALRAAMALFRMNPQAPGVRQTLAEVRHGFPAGTTATLPTEASRMLEDVRSRRQSSPRKQGRAV
jgi:DNA-binding winged helix-turn-helix (wHTH) protein